MKIAWLIQNLVPYHHAKFNAFAQGWNHETHLIQVTNRDAFGVLEFKSQDPAYALHTLFPEHERKRIDTKSLGLALGRTLDSIQPECVCVSGWGLEIGHLMQSWALRKNVPFVMCADSTAHDEPRVFWKEWIKSRLVKAASSALVAGRLHKDYICALGMDPDLVSMGYDVVNNAHFSKPIEQVPSALLKRIPEAGFFFACARFERKKNLPSLIRAHAEYVKRCVNEGREPHKLVVAGEGEMRAEIEGLIGSLNAMNDVALLGAVSHNDLPWLYQNCKAFVQASTTEQWGLVVNEAMAAGAPVLLSNRCGCAPDLVREGENGFLFDPFNEAEMADRLMEFHRFAETNEDAMRTSSRKIIAEWGLDRFAEGLDQAVKRAMEQGSRRYAFSARALLPMLLKRGHA